MVDEDTIGFFPPDAESPAAEFPFRGYVSPLIGSPFLSDERQFNLMFRSTLGSVDPLDEMAKALAGQTLDAQAIRKILDEKTKESAVYLRPETAQAMFVQLSLILI